MIELGVGAEDCGVAFEAGAAVSSPLLTLFGSAGVAAGGLAAGGVAVGAVVPLGFEPNESPCASNVGAKKAANRIATEINFIEFL